MPTTTTTTTTSTKGAGVEGLKIFEGFLSKRKPTPSAKPAVKAPTASSSPTAKKDLGAATAAAAAAAASKSAANKASSQKKAHNHASLTHKAAQTAHKASKHLSKRNSQSFSRFSTKVRLMILQRLTSERDILTFLQIEGACRDVLYIYPEAVFGRFRHVDAVPWIPAFPAKRDLFIRRSWYSDSGRWGLVQLQNRSQVGVDNGRAAKRSDALLLDLETKNLVTSRIVHPFPRQLASTSEDALQDWCDITSATFTSNERFLATTSRRLTCVCECAKATIVAMMQHPPASAIGEVEKSIVTNDGKYIILLASKEVHIIPVNAKAYVVNPADRLSMGEEEDEDEAGCFYEGAAVIRQPKVFKRQVRQVRYLPSSDVLIVGTLGNALECWDLSSKDGKPALFYRLVGSLIDPNMMLEVPHDPSGRKLLLAKKDGSGNAVLVDIRDHASAIPGSDKPVPAKQMTQDGLYRNRNVRQWPLVHHDITCSKRWEYSADGRWLMMISESCCAHLLRMWDLTADYSSAGETAPVEVDPATLFKTTHAGQLQYRGTVGHYIIAATYATKSDVADKILVLDTKKKTVKTVLNSGKHVTRGCPGQWTISPDGGCMATTCEASDEVWAWLVPNSSNTVPPQSKLGNHRKDPLARDAVKQPDRDLMNQIKKMQRSKIDAKAAVNEYFIVTDRKSMLIPAKTSSFFIRKLKENVGMLRAKDPGLSLKLTRKMADHLWETLRLLLLRKYHTNLDLRQLDLKDIERLSNGLTTLNGIPSALFASALEIISMDLLFRNPIEFRKHYANSLPTPSRPLKPAKAGATVGKKKAPPSSAKAQDDSIKLLNLLENNEALTESLWLHRPSLHLLGKTAVVELLMEDYAATEQRSIRFSHDGRWVLGGSRIYNISEAYAYLSAKESVESDCIEAVDRLNDIIDRLSCPCKNCADISSSLAALMNSSGQL